MKLKFFFLVGIFYIFSGCSKKEAFLKTEENVLDQLSEISESIEEKRDYRFVNSKDGLRLRKSPGLDGEKIWFLDNKAKVEVISKVDMTTQIGMLFSDWFEVQTEEGLSGFVFGGYLEKDLNDLEFIQRIEGKYADPNGENFITIEPSVNNKFTLKNNYPIFEDHLVNIAFKDLFTKRLFNFDIDGKGGIGGSYFVRFDENENLVFTEDRYILEFDDDLNIIDEQKIFNQVILEKISDTAEENPRISQSYSASLSSGEERKNYLDLFFYLEPQKSFILKKFDLKNFEEDFPLYKENFLIGTTAVFVNNELLSECRIKIGTSKKEVCNLLGIPRRIIRDVGQDYYEYQMIVSANPDKDEELSTSIAFYFDEYGKVISIDYSSEECLGSSLL